MNQIELIVEEINDLENELEYQDREFMALGNYILNKQPVDQEKTTSWKTKRL